MCTFWHSPHLIWGICFSVSESFTGHFTMKKSGFSFLDFCFLCNSTKTPCFTTTQTEGCAAVALFKINSTSSPFSWPGNLTFVWTKESSAWCWGIISCKIVIQSPTSPRFLCSSVSSSWCLILIWAISCCRASLRLESVPKLKRETAQISTWRATWGQEQHLERKSRF